MERRRDWRGKIKYFLKNYSAINLPAGLVVDGEIKDAEKLKIYIKNLLKNGVNGRIKIRGVIAALPETKTFLKEITAPKTANGDSFELLKGELEKQIPLSLDELYLDSQELEEVKNGGEVKILVAAAPRGLVDSYTRLLEISGLTPLVLETESLAITRTLLGDADDFMRDETTVMVDIGAERTGIIFWQNGSIRLSITSPVSGKTITAAIAKKENISLVEAEKLKIKCGLNPDKCGEIIRPIIMENLEELVKNIRSALRFHQERGLGAGKIEKLILSGGGANLEKLENILSQELKIKTRQATIPAEFIKPRFMAFNQEQFLSFVTAFGLAQRAVEDHVFGEK